MFWRHDGGAMAISAVVSLLLRHSKVVAFIARIDRREIRAPVVFIASFHHDLIACKF